MKEYAKSFIANKILDLQSHAEAFGLSGISQTNGIVNSALNYLTYTRQPVHRGFSQLGGGFENYSRKPPIYRDYSSWEAAERAFSRMVSPAKPSPQAASEHPRYQGKAFYEAADELRRGKARGDHKYEREEPAYSPPSRSAPAPPTKTAEKIRAGLDRGDHKFVREKPNTKPPKRKVMRPPEL